MNSGQDDFRMIQKVLRRLSESNQREREQSDFIILSESKILRLVWEYMKYKIFVQSPLLCMKLSAFCKGLS